MRYPGSITIKEKAVGFRKTCIVCFRCWHVCPGNAISMKMSPANGLIERLIYSETMARTFGSVTSHDCYGPNLYKDVLKRHIKLRHDRDNPTAGYEYHKNSV